MINEKTNSQFITHNSPLIKKGYKKTEIGVIPEDWEVNKLGEICNYQNGTSLEKYFNIKNGLKVISIGNYSPAGKFIENNTFIDIKFKSNINKFILNKDDLTMILNDKTSVGTIIGRVLLIDKSNKYVFNQRTMRLRTKDNILPLFLYFSINSDLIHNRIIKLAKPGTQIYVNTDDITQLEISYPKSKTEQKAIAEVLSDTDELIQTLEKQIAKKRLIKQGAMQKLLTPKDDWEVKKLGEIAEITGAGIDKKINEKEIPVTLLNYMDVFKRDYIYLNELHHKVTAPTNKVISCNVQKGDIFLTPSSEMRTDIGISAITMENMEGVVYSYHINRLRYIIDLDMLFGLYILKTNKFLSQAEKLCEGSGKRYVLSLRKFREMEIFYPKSKSEQTRIATILSDMDSEIDILENKLAKYKKIKQGMMQELLTGKTRLIINFRMCDSSSEC